MLDKKRVWREYELPGGGYTIAKLCLSRKRCVNSIIVSVPRDDSAVDIFAYQGELVEAVLAYTPTASLYNVNITPAEMYNWLYWTDAVNAIELAFKQPFCDMYPARNVTEELVRRWSAVQFPGWQYATLTGRGICFVKDFGSAMFGGTFAVEVADDGISVYKSSLVAGCSMSEDERTMFIDTSFVTIESFMKTCCWPYSAEIYNVHRALRRWVFLLTAQSL